MLFAVDTKKWFLWTWLQAPNITQLYCSTLMRYDEIIDIFRKKNIDVHCMLSLYLGIFVPKHPIEASVRPGQALTSCAIQRALCADAAFLEWDSRCPIWSHMGHSSKIIKDTHVIKCSGLCCSTEPSTYSERASAKWKMASSYLIRICDGFMKWPQTSPQTRLTDVALSLHCWDHNLMMYRTVLSVMCPSNVQVTRGRQYDMLAYVNIC